MGTHTTGSAASALGGWWWRSGEALACGGLLLAAGAVGLAAMLGMLDAWTRTAALGSIALAVGVVLLPRLPALLYTPRRRMAVLVGTLGLLWLGGAILPAAPTAASPAPELPASTTAPLAPLAQDAGSVTFVAPPRISLALFAQLLQHGVGGGTSPAAPHADDLYNIIVSYGLDPAVALAFFAQESQFCTVGLCAQYGMNNWGMTRAARVSQRVGGVVRTYNGNFVSYASWQDGVRDWCELILYGYVNKGVDTVAKAIPIYAPAADGNQPEVYIQQVHRRVAAWQGIDPETWNNNPSRYRKYPDLESGLMIETFRASGLDYQPTWAFHQFVMNEAKAGRPLGSPLGRAERIEINGQLYMVQPFALDTVYTPLASVESQTNWGDVRRMNSLLLNGGGGQ